MRKFLGFAAASLAIMAMLSVVTSPAFADQGGKPNANASDNTNAHGGNPNANDNASSKADPQPAHGNDGSTSCRC